jgi:hypothetical protein
LQVLNQQNINQNRCIQGKGPSKENQKPRLHGKIDLMIEEEDEVNRLESEQ